MTTVSVVVPFFNAAATLPRCLDALIQQERPAGGYEVLAVDNNSTDSSAAIVRRYPTVRMLSERVQSAYAARNRGLSEADGHLIAFTDPDCVAGRDWLRRLVDAMADPEVMVVMGRQRPAGRSCAIRILGEYDHRKEAYTLASTDPRLYYGHTNNLITRREVLEHVGPFVQMARGSDVVFVQRALGAYGARAVRYAPEAAVDHLEIGSARDYLRKAFVYGCSMRGYASLADVRSLRFGERRYVFRDTVRSGGLGVYESALLLVLLALGVAAHRLGWMASPARTVAADPTLASPATRREPAS